jgi:hypothetical protein
MSDPVDPRSLEALRRDREALAPDDARARVASRLGIVSPRPGPDPRPRAHALRAAAGGMHSGALLAIAFVAGGAVGALLHAGLAPAPETRVVYVSELAPSVPGTAPSGSMVAPISAATDSSPPASSATGAASTVVAPGTRVGMPQLDAERALLDAARIALVSGDTDTALRALGRHTRSYRRPLLGEERDALFVQALVRAGRYDEARTRADAFRRSAPQSLFMPAVDAAIASIP